MMLFRSERLNRPGFLDYVVLYLNSPYLLGHYLLIGYVKHYFSIFPIYFGWNVMLWRATSHLWYFCPHFPCNDCMW